MKRGEFKQQRIDRLIDEVWNRIFARQEAIYREHNRPSEPIFEKRPIEEIKPGTWIYGGKGPVVLGVLSDCKTIISNSSGRYYLPSEFLVRAGWRAPRPCECDDCEAVRQRKEMAA